MRHLVRNLEDLDSLALTLARVWQKVSASSGQPVLVSLEGELGAGKTAFVKALAGALGAKVEPVSPTFVLHQAYDYNGGRLHHFDLYRLKDPLHELPPLGFSDMLKEKNAIICVEWGERASALFSVPYITMKFQVQADDQRLIEVEGARK